MASGEVRSRSVAHDLPTVLDLAALGSAVAVAIVVIVNVWIGLAIRAVAHPPPCLRQPCYLILASLPWRSRVGYLTAGTNNISALVLVVGAILLIAGGHLQEGERAVHRRVIRLVLALSALVAVGALVGGLSEATGTIAWQVRWPAVADSAEAVVLGSVAVGLAVVCEQRNRLVSAAGEEPGSGDR